ncbi:MAG: bifunctional folylpolyglutamate synthase/dihydrofolate synthase [Ruminococcus sp.]|nr:bifunctional folylpolyglutamate synthase/dihydrofolate synthase [Ruminococcus sp.]
MFEYNNDPALAYIFGFSHSGKPVRDLGRSRVLLKALGDPQDRLRFVHIAGTNGKGSTARMFDGVFVRAGLKTGLFTSPFIMEYADRIQVNDKNIPAEDLGRLAEKVRRAVNSLPEELGFSQFEITQAIAFLYFEEQGCDIVVLETGLGGLLDCTNVITTPLLTVITKVDLDHTAILGDTIEKIARQKAGIIKEGVPCVLSAGNRRSVREIVLQKTRETGSQLVIPDDRLAEIEEVRLNKTFFTYRGGHFCTSMAGVHQVMNALSVIEGCYVLREHFDLTDEDISKGIEDAVLHGRTEVLCEKPLTILDGGHNPDGVRALARVIEGQRPCHAVIGMCKDKNLHEALRVLIPHVDSFVTVDGFSDRAENKEELAALINSLGGKAVPAEKTLAEETARLQTENPEGLTLICGSLYLVTEVLHSNIK